MKHNFDQGSVTLEEDLGKLHHHFLKSVNSNYYYINTSALQTICNSGMLHLCNSTDVTLIVYKIRYNKMFC